MILCLDIGNSQLFGGVFVNDELILRFRRSSNPKVSADELGTFLTAVLSVNNIDYKKIKQIAFCSVVPDAVYSLRNCCRHYFNLEPFMLKNGVKTTLNILYKNPSEVGSDRIANAIAAVHKYPQKNLIIADFGTALTFCAINAKREYLGGAIFPGIRVAMESLQQNTAKLPTVEIIPVTKICGKTTTSGIQGGLYFGYVAIIQEFFSKLRKECFQDNETLTIGTGGMARLFDKIKLFDVILPNLVLEGIHLALKLNKDVI